MRITEDRFVVMDVHGDTLSMSNSGTNLLTALGISNSGIGNNNLKYDAAYAPNLETILDFVIDETQIDVDYSLNGGVATNTKLNVLATTENRRYELAKAAIRDLPCKMPLDQP